MFGNLHDEQKLLGTVEFASLTLRLFDVGNMRVSTLDGVELLVAKGELHGGSATEEDSEHLWAFLDPKALSLVSPFSMHPTALDTYTRRDGDEKVLAPTLRVGGVLLGVSQFVELAEALSPEFSAVPPSPEQKALMCLLTDFALLWNISREVSMKATELRRPEASSIYRELCGEVDELVAHIREDFDLSEDQFRLLYSLLEAASAHSRPLPLDEVRQLLETVHAVFDTEPA